MALGVEAAGLQSTTLQASVPHTTHQMVVDVAVAGGRDKHQPVRVIHAQVLHLQLMLPQGLQHLGRQWHHSLLARLRWSPTMLT